MSALPSAPELVDLLGESVALAYGAGRELDAIGTMDAADMPLPTRARLPGASAYELFLARMKHPCAAEAAKSIARFVGQVEALDVPALWEPAEAGDDGGGRWKAGVSPDAPRHGARVHGSPGEAYAGLASLGRGNANTLPPQF